MTPSGGDSAAQKMSVPLVDLLGLSHVTMTNNDVKQAPSSFATTESPPSSIASATEPSGRAKIITNVIIVVLFAVYFGFVTHKAIDSHANPMWRTSVVSQPEGIAAPHIAFCPQPQILGQSAPFPHFVFSTNYGFPLLLRWRPCSV